MSQIAFPKRRAEDADLLWNWSYSEGGHYSAPLPVIPQRSMEALRQFFPSGEANELNFILFSTSGVHGSYTTIEEEEAAKPLSENPEEGDCEDGYRGGVTFVIIQPRLVATRYGNCRPQTPEDFAFLKKLRESSWAVVQKIGRHA